MMKKISIILIIVMVMINISVTNAYGNTTVTVRLPSFPVTLNGINIENEKSQYPLIVYKDITYFPMTYYDSRFLGLESIWNAKTGLTVEKTGVNWNYYKYKTNKTNYSTYSAKVANFNIKVNGEKIDNSKEEYPLLHFRNVIYFPLTWRFAVEEFGWKYSFDKINGLEISSSKKGSFAGQLTLPIITRENGEKGGFTMAGDYFYYEGADGIIYQSPVDKPLDMRKVYQLPKADGSTKYVYPNLKTQNGKAILSYDTNLILLNEDGTHEVLDVGYSNINIVDDDIYVIGNPNKDNHDDTTGIYKVNIKTDNIERIYHGPVSEFEIFDDIIYFTDLDDYLYKIPIEGGQAEKLTNEPVSHYIVLKGTIYYTLKNMNNQLYAHGNNVPINPGGKLKSLEIQSGYVVAIFDKNSESQYKMMIIDDNGKIIYKTIENVLLVRIENGKVVFVKDN